MSDFARFVVRAADAPSDPQFVNGQQWHLNNPSNPASDMNVTSVWADYRGSGVKVAVIDDGIEYSHPDLAANSDPSLGANFVFLQRAHPLTAASIWRPIRMARRVAGMIAADDNGLYGVGVAPDATFASLRMGFGASGGLDSDRSGVHCCRKFRCRKPELGFGGYFYDNFNDLNSLEIRSPIPSSPSTTP